MKKRRSSYSSTKTPWLIIAFLAVMTAAIGTAIYFGVRARLGDPVFRSQDDVPRVSVQEAFLAAQNGKAVLVDTRSSDQFAASHAAGAINLPLAEVETAIPKMDPEIWYITYCT